MAARRSSWLDDRAALLVRILVENHQLTIPQDVAREDISNQLDHIAERMRIQRPSAKPYISDQWVQTFADHIAEQFHQANQDDRTLRVVHE